MTRMARDLIRALITVLAGPALLGGDAGVRVRGALAVPGQRLEAVALTPFATGFGVASVLEEPMRPGLESIWSLSRGRLHHASSSACCVASSASVVSRRILRATECRESPMRSINCSNASSSPCIACSTSLRSMHHHCAPATCRGQSPSMSPGDDDAFNGRYSVEERSITFGVGPRREREPLLHRRLCRPDRCPNVASSAEAAR